MCRFAADLIFDRIPSPTEMAPLCKGSCHFLRKMTEGLLTVADAAILPTTEAAPLLRGAVARACERD